LLTAVSAAEAEESPALKIGTATASVGDEQARVERRKTANLPLGEPSQRRAEAVA